jgi:hypothetical protein
MDFLMHLSMWNDEFSKVDFRILKRRKVQKLGTSRSWNALHNN